jgi:dihydroorotate dehydrogenase electron transfer subunit
VNLNQSKLISNKRKSDEIFEMTLSYDEELIKPGQFFMVKSLEGSYLLPRPISVYDYDGSELKFLYKLVGKGTKTISNLKKGESIQLLGPLGNGFDIEEIKGKVALVSGGIGIAPLNYLIKKLRFQNIDSYLGFKDEVYSIENFKRNSKKLTVTTESGNHGKKGFITDYIDWDKYDCIVTCGPEIMMNKIIKTGEEKLIKTYISLERRMACGIGACLGCSVKTTEGMKRACKEGPVFLGKDLILEEQK